MPNAIHIKYMLIRMWKKIDFCIIHIEYMLHVIVRSFRIQTIFILYRAYIYTTIEFISVALLYFFVFSTIMSELDNLSVHEWFFSNKKALRHSCIPLQVNLYVGNSYSKKSFCLIHFQYRQWHRKNQTGNMGNFLLKNCGLVSFFSLPSQCLSLG